MTPCAAGSKMAAPPARWVDVGRGDRADSACCVCLAAAPVCPHDGSSGNLSHNGLQRGRRWRPGPRTSAGPDQKWPDWAWPHGPPLMSSRSWSEAAGHRPLEWFPNGCQSWTPRPASVPEKSNFPEPSLNLGKPETDQESNVLFWRLWFFFMFGFWSLWISFIEQFPQASYRTIKKCTPKIVF